MLEQPSPELATLLGDHARDGKTGDGTAEYHDELAQWCGDRLADCSGWTGPALSAEYRVDARILANRLELCRFDTAELREHEWNRCSPTPGQAIPAPLLLARDFCGAAGPAAQPGGAARRGPGSAVRGAFRSGRPAAQGAPQDRAQPFAGTEHLIGTELDARVLTRAPTSYCREAWRGRAGRGAGRDRGTSPLARAAAGRRLPRPRLPGRRLPGSADRAGAVRAQTPADPGVR